MENDLMRLAHASLIAIALSSPPTGWTVLDRGRSLHAGCDIEAAADLRDLDLLRNRAVQERLGLSEDRKAEIGRRLELTLDPEQGDLIQMILRQYHADRDRLRELEDPSFADDGEAEEYELPEVRAMAGEFPGRAMAMIDRVLTPGQRAALGTRSRRRDPDALLREVEALHRENARCIAAVLASRQREQLRQIAIDTEGVLAVVRPEVAARLKLDPVQQIRVRAIWDRARADLDRLRSPSLISPAYREGDDLEVWMKPRLSTLREESARIRADAREKIGQVLAR
jgi:hypothetical protein